MAVAKKVKPKEPDITDSLNIINNSTTTIETTSDEIQTGAPSVITKEETSEQKTITKDTQVIFRTSEDNKNHLKGFFANYGINLSKGIQLACFYLEQEIKNGNVDISAAGLISKSNKR